MLSVKLVFENDTRWRLISGNDFETMMIDKSRSELESMLERFAGRRITLVPEHSAVPVKGAEALPVPEPGDAGEETMVEDIPDEAPAEARAQAPKPGTPREVQAASEPELKHLSKVFHGRISRVNKIK